MIAGVRRQRHGVVLGGFLRRVPAVIQPLALPQGAEGHPGRHMRKAREVTLQRYHQLVVLGGFQAQLAFLILVAARPQDDVKQVAAGALRLPADDPGPGVDKVLRLYRGPVAPAGVLPQGKGVYRAFGGVVGRGHLPAFGHAAHGAAAFVHDGQPLVQHSQHGAGRQAAVIQGRVGVGRLSRHADLNNTGVCNLPGKIFFFSAAAHRQQQHQSQQQRQCLFHGVSSVVG